MTTLNHRPVVWKGPSHVGSTTSGLSVQSVTNFITRLLPTLGNGHYSYETLPLLLPITSIITQPRNQDNARIIWKTKAAFAGFVSAGLALQLTPPPPVVVDPFKLADTIFLRGKPPKITEQVINYNILPQIIPILDPTQRLMAPIKPWGRIAQYPFGTNLLPLVPPPPAPEPFFLIETAFKRVAPRFVADVPFYSINFFDQPISSLDILIQKYEGVEGKQRRISQFPGQSNTIPLYNVPTGTPFFGSVQDIARSRKPYVVMDLYSRVPKRFLLFAYLLLPGI